MITCYPDDDSIKLKWKKKHKRSRWIYPLHRMIINSWYSPILVLLLGVALVDPEAPVTSVEFTPGTDVAWTSESVVPLFSWPIAAVVEVWFSTTTVDNPITGTVELEILLGSSVLCTIVSLVDASVELTLAAGNCCATVTLPIGLTVVTPTVKAKGWSDDVESLTCEVFPWRVIPVGVTNPWVVAKTTSLAVTPGAVVPSVVEIVPLSCTVPGWVTTASGVLGVDAWPTLEELVTSALGLEPEAEGRKGVWLVVTSTTWHDV